MFCDKFEKFVAEKCECDLHKSHKFKPLSILLFDCWQREYDERPYKNFQISKIFFENRMKRTFEIDDWFVLIDYLEKRKPKSVRINCIEMPHFKDVMLIERFVQALANAKYVQLKNVSLPINILLELQKNITSSKIKKLDLSENTLTLKHLNILRCVLIHSESLENLIVENCSINENSIPVLADGIHKSRSIRGVDVSRPCPMSLLSSFDSSKYVGLAAQIVWQNKLTFLSLRQCNINGYDLDLLSEYLGCIESKLIHLDLQGNNLTAHGADLLFNALTKNKNLRELNLSGNNLGSRGGIVMARLISYTNLESLDITHNKIPGDLMFDLLCVLKKPRELKVLRIYGNSFNCKSATVLKRLLCARVFDPNNIDVTYTWDYSKDELCVVPQFENGRIRT